MPPSARVIIHSGSLGDWTGIEAIVDSAADWPQPWVLVIHTRYAAESSAYVDDSAQLIGDVVLGENASIWMNAVLRGDVHSIRVGR